MYNTYTHDMDHTQRALFYRKRDFIFAKGDMKYKYKLLFEQEKGGTDFVWKIFWLVHFFQKYTQGLALMNPKMPFIFIRQFGNEGTIN